VGKLEEGKGKQARIRGREDRWAEREEEASRERKSIQEGEGKTKGSSEKRKD